MTPSVYNVLIIGAGQIGAFYDKPGDTTVKSHAHAFSRHPGFHLLGFVDSDLNKASQAAQQWGGQSWASVTETMANNTVGVAPDIIIVAVPDATHAEVLSLLCQYKPRLVLAEKPLALTYTQSEQLVKLYQQAGIALMVNYLRRFLPELQTLHHDVREGKLGEYRSGIGYYGKGLFHNGSHLLDLLTWLLPNAHFQPRFLTQAIEDFTPDDPSLGAVLTSQNHKPFVLQPVPAPEATVFELDLTFERGRVKIFDLGHQLQVFDVLEDSRHPGYRTQQARPVMQTSLQLAMTSVAEHLYQHLNQGVPLQAAAVETLPGMALCQAIRNNFQLAASR